MNLRIVERDKLFAQYGEPTTLDELFEWIKAVIGEQDVGILGLSWDITYTDKVSNSHRAPIGEATNWDRDTTKPCHYPGFGGRLWIRYKNYPKTFGSEPVEKTFTHTGTGGVGGYIGPWERAISAYYNYNLPRRGERVQKAVGTKPHCFSWDYRFFLQDFPALQKNIEQQQVLNILSGDTEPLCINSKKTWTDPQAEIDDNEIIRLDKRRALQQKSLAE